jgi:acetolactate synthase regulatory subunit
LPDPYFPHFHYDGFIYIMGEQGRKSMPRQIEITLPSERTDELLEQLQKIEEISSLSAQRGGSIQSKGDIIRLTGCNVALHEVMRVVEARGLHEDAGVSINTNTLMSSISASQGKAIRLDRSETTWEEMIGRESNMSPNAIIIMAMPAFLLPPAL